MRFDQSRGRNAYEIVNGCTKEKLEEIFRKYGEERMAGRIARAVVERRAKAPVRTTGELADIIAGSIPAKFRSGKIHPATRVFQALRIARQ